MAKTKTFGVRLTPNQIVELERLRSTFAFTSYGELIGDWVQLLQQIDTQISRIHKHPRDWGPSDLDEHLMLRVGRSSHPWNVFASLLLRRIKARFGEDGVERINMLLERKWPDPEDTESALGST